MLLVKHFQKVRGRQNIQLKSQTKTNVRRNFFDKESFVFKSYLRLIWLLCLMAYSHSHANGLWDGLSSHQQRSALIKSAQHQYQKQKIHFQERAFRSDCSGFIQGVIWDQGHDLNAFYKTYRWEVNGVALIQKYIERVGQFGKRLKPQKGDLVFFNQTYDKNKDGLRNDPLTHLGIITHIDQNHTITFLHHMQGHVQKGYMNLKLPRIQKRGGKTFNSLLTRSVSQNLAAQLFEGLGKVYSGAS